MAAFRIRQEDRDVSVRRATCASENIRLFSASELSLPRETLLFFSSLPPDTSPRESSASLRPCIRAADALCHNNLYFGPEGRPRCCGRCSPPRSFRAETPASRGKSRAPNATLEGDEWTNRRAKHVLKCHT